MTRICKVTKRLTLPTTNVLCAIGITKGGALAATPSPFHPLLVRTSEEPGPPELLVASELLAAVVG